jgi:hypothetical protein
MWDLISGGLGLLGGLFGGSQSKASYDPSQYYNQARANQRYAENKYGNVNSDYYTRARQNQMKSLFDLIASSNRQNAQQNAGQGLYGSGKLLQAQSKNAIASAGDQANQFTGSLYTQGQNYVQQARQALTDAYGHGADMSAQVSMGNAQNQQNMWSGIAEMGGGLLGQYFGRQPQQQPWTPNPMIYSNMNYQVPDTSNYNPFRR